MDNKRQPLKDLSFIGDPAEDLLKHDPTMPRALSEHFDELAGKYDYYIGRYENFDELDDLDEDE